MKLATPWQANSVVTKNDNKFNDDLKKVLFSSNTIQSVPLYIK